MNISSSFRLCRFTFRKCLSRRLQGDTCDRYYCSKSSSTDQTRVVQLKNKLACGPSFQDFIKSSTSDKSYDACNYEYEEYHIPECTTARSQKVYFETYGCQMNVSDTEIAWSILQKAGYSRTHELPEADVVLLVTCSVREKAEQTIWNRLKHLTALKKRSQKHKPLLKIGVLGCMAERLKTKLLEQEKLVDVLAGPDAYRHLPRLLSLAYGGQRASNVLLSLEETYADVMPVHQTPEGHSAFVSIMRGCDNMCSYCIVPFTRGRERSRPLSSILEEVRMLSDQVLQLIQERRNICKQIHLPAQSSSSRVLHAMRRGYTREAYLDLVENIREIIPGVSLSSDFITGFCGETEEDHQQTLSLVREVGYNVGFLFAYSMRKKTHAYHRLQDDVLAPVKQRRLEELISVFREEATKVNMALLGSTQLVLVEGESKRSSEELCGRNDGNVKVVFPKTDLPVQPEKPQMVPITPGDYVLVKITSANSQCLRGHALIHSSLNDRRTSEHLLSKQTI
ncbi:mitochondrial tRNA methylthiotransferase CDK5RAP1 isoform X2 [Sinocyclocheilus rhinocerous]|uniref:mitochondrial tRNA methylthiotransferase CDK5RAP1 isoform X2 n=1 Tax=Sinocyclocheilus rhinocerous TaxID=307959 RepID=UPI0007B810DD|nr:PREDICTED: CDK5 regulatory subunit-associated protein 1 isoform X2 [Sinocyclocheilus rhinocerous]